MGEEGVVTLRVRRESSADEPMVALEVEDTGPGMDARRWSARRPRVHDQVDRERSRLTLVQRIVEQHGGRFGMESHAGSARAHGLRFRQRRPERRRGRASGETAPPGAAEPT